MNVSDRSTAGYAYNLFIQKNDLSKFSLWQVDSNQGPFYITESLIWYEDIVMYGKNTCVLPTNIWQKYSSVFSIMAESSASARR
jgi:hypothetical protein